MILVSYRWRQEYVFELSYQDIQTLKDINKGETA
jgi:hypothetical protein